MTKKIIQNTIGLIVTTIIIIAIIQVTYYYYSEHMKLVNHNEITEFIDTELTFEQDSLTKELAMIDDFLDERYLNNEDIGRLYERKSNIYKFQNDYANYARSIGYALYYLENSDDIDYTANILLDLAMFYLVNDNYECAQDSMAELYEITSIENIKDNQVRSYAYRLRGILKFRNKQYFAAEQDFLKAQNAIANSNTGIYEEAYTAMNEVNLAKVYYFEGRLDEAQAIIDKYEDSDLFNQSTYASFLVRDFVLPYYEAVIYITSSEAPEYTDVLDIYMSYCEQYNYFSWELNTLIFLLEHRPPATKTEMKSFYTVINKAYANAAYTGSQTYTALINGEIEDSIETVRDNQYHSKSRSNRTRIYLIILLVSIILAVTTGAIIKTSKYDALTGVLSRGAFDDDLAKTIKRNTPYGIIMIDIDDFKKVNDTYGHQTGDIVLKELGKILVSFKNSQITPYRYGGEEFVVIVYANALSTINLIGENIRKVFSIVDWDFAPVTLSVGIAVSDDDFATTLKRADENLYISKTTGKNKTTFK